MADSQASQSQRQPQSASAGAPGYDGGAPTQPQQHMPPPPLAPVIIPQNTNPIPTAISSPMSGNPMSPTSGGAGYVPRRAAPEPNKRALYVGGLDPRVTEDVLRQIFETTGHVQSVKIIPDKNVSVALPSPAMSQKGFNYGFVEFDDPAAAERAMQTLNGRRVHNNEIRVNWAYQSNNTAKEDTSNHFHIFVGDLSNEVNDEVLLQAFSTFGPVSEARVMWDMKTGRSRGYGFVAFRDRADAERALSSMDGEWLGSRAIRCNWANQKGQPSISQQQAMASMGMAPTTPFGHHHFPTHGVQSYDMVVQQTPQWQTTCYVGNLTPYTSQSDLVPLFQNFGYVTETRFQSDRGFAFIKMDTHENAAMAICQLNGYNVNGRPLKCSWGKDRPPTGQFDGYSPQAGPNSAYPQTPSQYFPQYGAGPGGPMSPQGERHQRKLRYRKVQSNARAGPSPGGQPFAQNQAGFGGPGMAQPYQQMPGSAGGYNAGRGGQPPQQQWGQQPQGNFNQNGFGGYQG
ncbi:RNA recognition domain-containing protein [Paraphaeosphaeria minitans]|uniref:RNA recognition domain-containing protein n=1 Tax=Paraphaeosphaeria minitans TaxID=565426 RepID=A0A9P6GQ37_9PLEO|nr:RNA recognition domain-containing protein [Paraphaeosphaeria minitans]